MKFPNSDRWLIGVVVALSFFGLLMVYDASAVVAMKEFGSPLYFLKEQGKWLLVGMVAFITSSRIPYKIWYKLALPLLLISILLLLAVFIPGVGVRALGAHRWISFGIFVLQPAELAKFTLINYLAAWFSSFEKGRLTAFLLLVTTVVGLIVLEPDLGTAIVIAGVALCLYLFSGHPLWHVGVLIPIGIAAVLLLAVSAPYRFNRLTTFINPEHDPLGASYQIRQALLAIGSGGFTGIGVGQSRQKYAYLPEATTDSIFAIIAEETGLAGGLVVVFSFLFIVFRSFRIAARAVDRYGKLLALGIGSWIGIQSIVNIGAMVALLPLTGIPLPFLSYGGSSLVVLLLSCGILVSISKHRS